MNKITYIIIALWVAIFSSANAQKRKIRANESYIICYADSELRHMMPMINKPGDTIVIFKYKTDNILLSDVWTTVYKGDTVYIHDYDLKEIGEEDKKIERQKEVSDSLTTIKESLLKRKFLINKYGLKMANLISAGYIKIGMTKEMAKYSWGEPNKINRTVFATHSHEQWVYPDGHYLYFDNGILTAWQD